MSCCNHRKYLLFLFTLICFTTAAIKKDRSLSSSLVTLDYLFVPFHSIIKICE